VYSQIQMKCLILLMLTLICLQIVFADKETTTITVVYDNKDYQGKIVFGKLNVDEDREIAIKYRIMSIPALLVFKDGEIADQIIGAQPRNALEPQITKHL